jgi:biopolymer transport protein ExbB/TolQ
MFCIYALSAWTLQSFGLFEALYHADFSKLSFIIIGLFTLLTIYTGYLTYRISKGLKVLETHIETCWFFAGEMPTLGLIGTVIGFILMLTAFTGLDVSDVLSIQAALESMVLGMGSALLTTLTGMVCGFLLKLQLMNLHGKI